MTSDRRAQPPALTAADLKGFVGRYGSDEIGSVFRIEAGQAGLIVRLDHSPAKSLEFSAIDRDTFQKGMMTVRFERDGKGNVVALDYSNPLVRHVRFARMGDTLRRR